MMTDPRSLTDKELVHYADSVLSRGESLSLIWQQRLVELLDEWAQISLNPHICIQAAKYKSDMQLNLF